jgi:hypothetical protein
MPAAEGRFFALPVLGGNGGIPLAPGRPVILSAAKNLVRARVKEILGCAQA